MSKSIPVETTIMLIYIYVIFFICEHQRLGRQTETRC